MSLVNIDTQSFNVPNIIGATFNPDRDLLQQNGWRDYDDPAPVLDGYVRTGLHYEQDPNDEMRAIAIYTDITQEDYDSQQLADDISKNIEKYTYENNFLLLCDQLNGGTTHTKMSFVDLEAAITSLQATDPLIATQFSLKLLMLDAALKRFDILWWDTCVWHNLPS